MTRISRRTFAFVLLLATASLTGAAPADPGKPGKFPVGTATVKSFDTARSRILTSELWYPAKSAGRDAPIRKGFFPLVMMAHGFCGSRLNYEYLTTHLASWGFIVAAPDFAGVTRADCDAGTVTASFDDLPYDLSFVCRDLHDTSGRLADWAKHMRGSATGLVGHSLGGGAVIGAARIDEFFTNVIALAPSATAQTADGLDDLTPRAWMVMGGTADTLVSFTDWTQPFWEAAPTPKFLVKIDGGTHGGFGDSDSSQSAEGLEAQHDAVKRNATALLNRYLALKPRFAKKLRTAQSGAVALTAKLK
jgi:alpha-beta hydrolase superfamily lysophospholipase